MMKSRVEDYRVDIQSAVHERVRNALINPNVSVEQKKDMLKAIRPDQLPFFMKTLTKEILKVLK
ncbi:hypothetical protein [Paenibacillus cremeus]|uniref:Uncharacterized protein n=1 Tax=Paenibacillus cremeus TaxID=2163881 RepID=A0A559KE17_9BACL|nr:hypothetical protein [Paenibacillus cremeus]TVY10353.1 hypothetical protein FPZ49_08100 [Paenibacillus cremeus]